MWKLRFVPLALVVAATGYMVWSSSPTTPLTLTRQQAIDRAAPDATVSGKLVWKSVESKLVTYREWSRVLSGVGGSLGYVDTTDRDALVWIVVYLGPMVSMGGGHCDWGLRAFSADSRMPTGWGAAECGEGRQPSGFDLLPDRSWFRLDDLRGDEKNGGS